MLDIRHEIPNLHGKPVKISGQKLTITTEFAAFLAVNLHCATFAKAYGHMEVN